MRISIGQGAGKKGLAANTYPIDEYESKSKHYFTIKYQSIAPSIEQAFARKKLTDFMNKVPLCTL